MGDGGGFASPVLAFSILQSHGFSQAQEPVSDTDLALFQNDF